MGGLSEKYSMLKESQAQKKGTWIAFHRSAIRLVSIGLECGAVVRGDQEEREAEIDVH